MVQPPPREWASLDSVSVETSVAVAVSVPVEVSVPVSVAVEVPVDVLVPVSVAVPSPVPVAVDVGGVNPRQDQQIPALVKAVALLRSTVPGLDWVGSALDWDRFFSAPCLTTPTELELLLGAIDNSPPPSSDEITAPITTGIVWVFPAR